MNDIDEVITLSPAFMPLASKANWSAAVPDPTETAYFVPHILAKAASNLNTLSPSVSRSFRNAFAAASTIWSVITGDAIGTFISFPSLFVTSFQCYLLSRLTSQVRLPRLHWQGHPW